MTVSKSIGLQGLAEIGTPQFAGGGVESTEGGFYEQFQIAMAQQEKTSGYENGMKASSDSASGYITDSSGQEFDSNEVESDLVSCLLCMANPPNPVLPDEGEEPKGLEASGDDHASANAQSITAQSSEETGYEVSDEQKIGDTVNHYAASEPNHGEVNTAANNYDKSVVNTNTNPTTGNNTSAAYYGGYENYYTSYQMQGKYNASQPLQFNSFVSPTETQWSASLSKGQLTLIPLPTVSKPQNTASTSAVNSVKTYSAHDTAILKYLLKELPPALAQEHPNGLPKEDWDRLIRVFTKLIKDLNLEGNPEYDLTTLLRNAGAFPEGSSMNFYAKYDEMSQLQSSLNAANTQTPESSVTPVNTSGSENSEINPGLSPFAYLGDPSTLSNLASVTNSAIAANKANTADTANTEKKGENETALADGTAQKASASAPVVTSAGEEKAVLPQSQVNLISEEIIARLATKNGVTTFEMTLNPVELGKITVKLVMKDAKLSVEIVAEKGKTAALLQNSADRIGASLEKNDIKLEYFSVNVEQKSDYSEQQGNKGGNRGGREGNERSGTEEENGISFEELLQGL
ncbi:MAG: flagellar hook-length control protein FliK [Oscillospiraceae bacterium]|nr:flagellar hook-length control protein FliK [Oscillospiraceae bacterium]